MAISATLQIVGLLLAVVGGVTSANDKNQLRFLGEMHGRAYYYQAKPQVDWETAKSICKSDGLELATFNTFEQTMATVRALRDDLGTKSNNLVWTGGRENSDPVGFQWDNRKYYWDISVLGSWKWNDYKLYQYCVELEVTSQNQHWFSGGRCEWPRSVLCMETFT